MSAEERTAAGQKGYENRIAKGRHNKWEEQYAKFEDYDGMPVHRSTLSNWKKSQLARFEARIKTEIAGNDWSTAWRDGSTKLLTCIAKKENNKWEEQYAEFKDYDGMPKRGSTLSNWKKNQLARFVDRIKKEIAANNGSTVWSDRITKLEDYIAKKKSA